VTSIHDDTGAVGPVSVPLSALEHVDYCQRQAALIHLEATWTENLWTVRGDLVHHGVDLPAVHRRHGTTVIRSLPVHSQAYGLHGICDLVEFTGDTARPVEYKAGPYEPGGPADVQLAGQAACLSEAGFAVPVGFVYSATDRRRHQVVVSEALLERMRQAIEAMRALLAQHILPPARNDTRCRRCSLRDDCLPELTHGHGARTVELFTPRPLGSWRD
jgi:CRISPR-associated exonuclease Cas4